MRGGAGVYTVPFIIAGNFQPGFSQSTLDRADARQRADAAVDAVESVSGRRARAGGRVARRRHVPRPGLNTRTDAVRAARLPERSEHALHDHRPARAAGAVADRGRATPAAAAGISPRRRRPDRRDRSQRRFPSGSLSTSRQRDQATIDFLAQLVSEPRLPACCRGRASTARRSRGRSCCGRIRSSATCARSTTTAASDYKSVQVKIEHRFTRGYLDARGVYRGRSSPRTCSS